MNQEHISQLEQFKDIGVRIDRYGNFVLRPELAHNPRKEMQYKTQRFGETIKLYPPKANMQFMKHVAVIEWHDIMESWLLRITTPDWRIQTEHLIEISEYMATLPKPVPEDHKEAEEEAA